MIINYIIYKLIYICVCVYVRIYVPCVHELGLGSELRLAFVIKLDLLIVRTRVTVRVRARVTC